MPTSVALVGFGPWGRNIARNLNQLGVLTVVCDPDLQARAAAKSAYPQVITVEHPEQVPTDCAVAIAAPAAQHAELARLFLGRKQHVFVEKPLALQVSECAPLLALAKEHGLVLQVGHLLHHHPAVNALDALIQKGALGRLQYLTSNRLNLGRFRREENSLWSFAPHDIAVMLRLVGSLPERISATGGYFLHPQVADTTLTSLSWPSGVQGHIYVSWLHPYKEQRLVVVGSDAMAVFDDQLPWASKLVLYRHGVEWQNGVPVPRKADAEPVPLVQDEPLLREMQVFLDAVADPTLPLVADGAEGTRVLTVLDAAERSLRQQGTPVVLAPPSSRPVRIHPSAVVGDKAQVGEGTSIWHFVHVMDGARIGRDCSLGQNVFVQDGAVLGDRVRVQNNVSIYKGVTLGDGVFCGPSCVFTNVVRPRADVSRKEEFAATLVGTGATIGANATIVCGNTIGAHAFIAAGAVVTRPVPAHALVSGNPARVRGWVCRCGEKLALAAKPAVADTAACHRCTQVWRSDGENLIPVNH